MAPPVGALVGIFTEDPEEAKRSFLKLADLEFEVAVFGHGKPVVDHASDVFRTSITRLR